MANEVISTYGFRIPGWIDRVCAPFHSAEEAYQAAVAALRAMLAGDHVSAMIGPVVPHQGRWEFYKPWYSTAEKEEGVQGNG